MTEIQSLARGLRILEILAGSPKPVSVTELAEQLNLDKGSASRLVTTLANYGYAEKDPISRRFSLGPQVVSLSRSLLARLEQAGFTWDKPDERLLRELALFADKCDITEETTRLASHLRQARDLLRGREAAGRPLDFLLQEIMREINTIGSKANDAAILQRVVAFKAEVERIREQVQNIE